MLSQLLSRLQPRKCGGSANTKHWWTSSNSAFAGIALLMVFITASCGEAEGIVDQTISKEVGISGPETSHEATILAESMGVENYGPMPILADEKEARLIKEQLLNGIDAKDSCEPTHPECASIAQKIADLATLEVIATKIAFNRAVYSELFYRNLDSGEMLEVIAFVKTDAGAKFLDTLATRRSNQNFNEITRKKAASNKGDFRQLYDKYHQQFVDQTKGLPRRSSQIRPPADYEIMSRKRVDK